MIFRNKEIDHIKSTKAVENIKLYIKFQEVTTPLFYHYYSTHLTEMIQGARFCSCILQYSSYYIFSYKV